MKLHGRRHERVVFGKFELGREDTAFVWSSLRPLDHGFPEKEIIFVDGAGSDALGRVGGENAVTIVVELRDPTLQYQFMKSSL